VAFNGYDIDTPDAARGVIATARNRFDDIDGIEHRIESDGAAAGAAAKEGAIDGALQDAVENFLKPFIVVMIEAGRKTFDGTESVVNIYDNADTSMSDNVKAAAVSDMVHEVELMDDLPDYDSSTSTGGSETGVHSW